MLGKAFLIAGLLVSTGANAAIATLNQSGVDQSGASLAKTTIIDLPTQATGFDFSGALDGVGSVQSNQSPGTEFGLYLGGTLLKDISFFTVDTTNNIYSFSFINLAAGDYSFRFNINGNAASRAYSFASTITPVPEPESLSLMMFGIGIAGLIARRKKSA